MGIADITIQKPPRGPECSVCLALRTLPKTEAAAFRRLLSDPTVRYTALSAALRDEGHDFHEKALSRHARGRCEAREKLR